MSMANNNDTADIAEIPTGTVVTAQVETGKQQHTADEENNGLQPPTRRTLIFCGFHLLAVILLLAGLFEPLAIPDAGQSVPGTAFTMWRSCKYDAQKQFKNCTDIKDGALVCDAAKGVMGAAQAFLIIAIASSLAAMSGACASFLGSATFARNLRGFCVSFTALTLFLSIVAWAMQLIFTTRPICDAWSDPLLSMESAGNKLFKLGPTLPLCVSGTGAQILAMVTVVLPPMQFLDAFVESNK